MSARSRAALVGVVLALCVVVLAAGAAVAGYGVTATERTPNRPATTAPPPPAVLARAAAAPTTAAAPAAVPLSAAGVRRAVGPALGAAALGPSVRATIVDLATGTTLYDRAGRTPVPPASTAKVLTAAALLAVRRPTDRIRTTVRAGSGGAVALVGGGDPTLTGVRGSAAAPYPGAARIGDLATQLRRAGVHPSRIVVDDSLFSGPAVSPAWAAEDVPSEYGAAITAVMADGGRDTPAATQRSAAPDLAAGHELAAALGAPSLPVARGPAGAGRTLATVESAPFGILIDQMLQESDNVIAECLGRQVALADRRPASFTGAAAAVRDVLRRLLSVDVGAGLVDASGLAAVDRVSTAALVGVLHRVAATARLRAVLPALPVGGWSGTLAARDRDPRTAAAAGVVRAKTGTLTGVSALAGIVHVRSGESLAFALDADRAPATAGAEAALDAAVARLARCGC